MNKIVITEWNRATLIALISENQVLELRLEEKDSSVLNHIFIGKVKNIVTNINSAFVDYQDGKTGYYSLVDNQTHHFTRAKGNNRICVGDEILVQVQKDAVKTKDPVLTSNLNFSGYYCVLTAGKNQIGFSAKIPEGEWKAAMKEALTDLVHDDFGLIIRTNAQHAAVHEVLKEVMRLCAVYHKVVSEASYRTCYSCLYHAAPAYVQMILGQPAGSLSEVITDDPALYELLKKEVKDPVRLYTDSILPLRKLYRLEAALEHALEKNVWLKSGGYLVIEPTEAMTVIDVNTGKYTGKKSLAETIKKINLEAAEEVAHQIRLRNISGIIIVDFIDMKSEEDRNMILTALSDAVRFDSVKTTVVDMTKLNLIELTRKKTSRPLYEQWKTCSIAGKSIEK